MMYLVVPVGLLGLAGLLGLVGWPSKLMSGECSGSGRSARSGWLGGSGVFGL